MFLKQGAGRLISWSVLSLETRVVRESGQASTLADCLAQAGPNEDVLIGQALPKGSAILEDGSIHAAPQLTSAVTPAEVKAEAGRRLKYTDWYFTRVAEDPTKPVPDDVRAERTRIRDRAAALEAMDPIPADFKDWKHWQ